MKMLSIVLGLALAFLIGFSFPVINQDGVTAAYCYGSSCWGYNPNSMGCTGSTVATNWSLDSFTELRYATDCDAEWARTQNTSTASKYAAATIATNLYTTRFSITSPSRISQYQTVYTKMVAPGTSYSSTACGRVRYSGPISIPIPYSIDECTDSY